jgi:hypothetical protein
MSKSSRMTGVFDRITHLFPVKKIYNQYIFSSKNDIVTIMGLIIIIHGIDRFSKYSFISRGGHKIVKRRGAPICDKIQAIVTLVKTYIIHYYADRLTGSKLYDA